MIRMDALWIGYYWLQSLDHSQILRHPYKVAYLLFSLKEAGGLVGLPIEMLALGINGALARNFHRKGLLSTGRIFKSKSFAKTKFRMFIHGIADVFTEILDNWKLVRNVETGTPQNDAKENDHFIEIFMLLIRFAYFVLKVSLGVLSQKLPQMIIIGFDENDC